MLKCSMTCSYDRGKEDTGGALFRGITPADRESETGQQDIGIGRGKKPAVIR